MWDTLLSTVKECSSCVRPSPNVRGVDTAIERVQQDKNPALKTKMYVHNTPANIYTQQQHRASILRMLYFGASTPISAMQKQDIQ